MPVLSTLMSRRPSSPRSLAFFKSFKICSNSNRAPTPLISTTRPSASTVRLSKSLMARTSQGWPAKRRDRHKPVAAFDASRLPRVGTKSIGRFPDIGRSSRRQPRPAILRAAVVAGAEVRPIVLGRIMPAQDDDDEVVGPAADVGTERGLEAAPEVGLDRIEIGLVGGVALRLGAAEPDPPALARRVDALRAAPRQEGAREFRLLVARGKNRDDGAAAPERVFVDEPFVFGQPLRKRPLQSAARGRADH